MKKAFKYLLDAEGTPVKGLIGLEWAVLLYMMATTVMIVFCFTDLVNPMDMIGGRIRALIIFAITLGVYHLQPCRLTMLARIAGQASMLPWWYADTYELNRILPNLDHVFARMEQSLFGCQPSLEFSKLCPWDFFSESLYLGYYSYFYLILFTALVYFFKCNMEFTKAASVILCSFFIYYLVFVFLPVTGPQYYYQAIGLDNVMQGIFPDVGNYFKFHQEMIEAPGMDGGFFRSFVTSGPVHEGERPTAAFPSSHIGISTVCGCLLVRMAWKHRVIKPLFLFTPLYLCLCMATVYIHAHYLVDAIAGFVTGVALFFLLWKFVKE